MTLIDELDALAHAGSGLAFEFGWKANEYIAEVAEQEASVPFRTVLTESLDILAQRYCDYMVKNTLTDRVKVTRFFTREHVAEIPGHPTFNHLRACFVMGEWPDADEDATLRRVGWAVENGWPAPDVIRQQFGNGDKSQSLIEKCRRICMQVAELPDVDPILESYCRAIVDYHCGEDGKWKEKTPQFNGKDSMDDAVQSELLEAE